MTDGPSEGSASGDTPGSGPPSDSASPGHEPGSRDETVYHCDLCGSVMLNLHCKLICETCGYKRDCSDP